MGNTLQGLFIFGALALLVFQYQADWFKTFSLSFVAIILEAFPFMLLGSLVGGVIDVFVPRDWIAAVLPEKKRSTVFLAAGLGLIFPVCECAVVPVVKRLLRKGVPLSAAIAYLLGGPIVNPIVGASTAVAYNFSWSVVIMRLGAGYVVAVCAGILIDTFFTKKQALLAGIGADPSPAKKMIQLSVQAPPLTTRLIAMVRVATGDFLDMARFLIIGAFIAGVMQTLITRQTLATSVAGSDFISILFMMFLAIALNLCSEADAFVAASFRNTPISLAAQLAFMVLGPMLDIKLLLMYLRLFHKRVIIVLAGTVFLLVLLVILGVRLLGI